jgi:hypothetical protein
MNTSRINETETPAATAKDIKHFRKSSLLFLFFTMLFLFAYSKLFKPGPRIQKSLIQSLEEKHLLQGLLWYSEHSIGSLSLPDKETCTVTPQSLSESCAIIPNAPEPGKLFTLLEELSLTEKYQPYIWSTALSGSDQSITFSLYTVTPLKIHAVKKVPYSLGDLIETLPSFTRTSLSPVTHRILSETREAGITGVIPLSHSDHTEYQHVIFLKKHPMGYYLEVPPLP